MNNNNIPNIYNIKIFDPLNHLKNIGTKLSDFEEFPKDGKNYFLLGKGNFGYAEKMKSKKNNSIYAIKKLNKNSPNFNSKDFFRETQNMINLNHKNIIKFYGYFQDKEKIQKYKEIIGDANIGNQNDVEIFCLVLEFAPNGSLENLYKKNLKKNSGHFKPLPQDIIIQFLKQTLEALYYLGTKSIMHRDIKPDNLLLDEGDNIKISDFGISALFYDQNPENANKPRDLFSELTQKGRIDFISPEVADENYDFRADIFSLGLTMLCFVSEEYPILKPKQVQIQNFVRNVKIDKIDNSYNIYLKNLILRMISYNQKLRPYANEALEELKHIEEIIRNPNNPFSLDYLENINKKFQQNTQQKIIKLDINFNKNNQNNNNNFNQNNFNQNNFNQNNFNQNNLNQKIFQRNNSQNLPFIHNNNNINNFNQNNLNNGNNNNFNNQNSRYPNNVNFPQGNINNQNYPFNLSNSFLNFQVMNNFPFGNPINTPFYQSKNAFLYNPNFNFQNPIKMDVNPQNFLKNITDNNMNPKNGSLISVLQCLSIIFKNENVLSQTRFIVNDFKKYKPNLTITYNIIHAIDFINDSLGKNNKIEFSVYINNFRKNLSIQIDTFKGVYEINPRKVFEELFSYFNKEIIDFDIPWKNNLLDSLIKPLSIAKNQFPELYYKVENFTKQYSNLFVEFFYFIFLETVKCNKCSKIISVTSDITPFFNLDSSLIENISYMIKTKMSSHLKKTNINYYCMSCGDTNGIFENKFFSSPKYLMIDFVGKIKNQKVLDYEIDLTEYMLTNIGPKKYKLYGYICQDQNRKFNTCIWENNCWKIHSEENEVSTFNTNHLNSCNPHIAIYKGI